jgi:hypothetical protein
VEEVGTGTDTEDSWKLSDTPGRVVRVGWSPHSADGRFDVALVDRGRATDAPSLQRAASDSPKPSRLFLTTDPLAAAFMQQSGLELGKTLRDQLPEPLLPAAVLAVNEMPFTHAPSVTADIWRENDGWVHGQSIQR